MCKAMAFPERFDARLCPLLQGLSPEEQDERIRTDPIIAACIAAMEGRAPTTPRTAQQLAAYEARSLCADALAGNTAAPAAQAVLAP